AMPHVSWLRHALLTPVSNQAELAAIQQLNQILMDVATAIEAHIDDQRIAVYVVRIQLAAELAQAGTVHGLDMHVADLSVTGLFNRLAVVLNPLQVAQLAQCPLGNRLHRHLQFLCLTLSLYREHCWSVQSVIERLVPVRSRSDL